MSTLPPVSDPNGGTQTPQPQPTPPLPPRPPEPPRPPQPQPRPPVPPTPSWPFTRTNQELAKISPYLSKGTTAYFNEFIKYTLKMLLGEDTIYLEATGRVATRSRYVAAWYLAAYIEENLIKGK